MLISGENENTITAIIIAQTISKDIVASIVPFKLHKSFLKKYTEVILDIAAIIPPQIKHMKRSYIGIIIPYNPIPSAPSFLESIMEKINPNTPVVKFEIISIDDSRPNVSFCIKYLLQLVIIDIYERNWLYILIFKIEKLKKQVNL